MRASRLFQSTIGTVFGVLALAAPPAVAETGHIADPAGDFPDIRRLDYNNAQAKVTLTLTFDDSSAAQNQSFYLQWGQPKRYQVFFSPGVDITELRFYRSATAVPRTVACPGLRVTEDAGDETTKAVIPRTCIDKAPDTLRFKANSNAGVGLEDITKLSPKVKRG